HHPVLVGPHAGEDRGPAHRCDGRRDGDVGQGRAPPTSALSELGERWRRQPACRVVAHPVPTDQEHLGPPSFMLHRVCHPFTAPAARPALSCRWPSTSTIVVAVITITVAAITMGHWVVAS